MSDTNQPAKAAIAEEKTDGKTADDNEVLEMTDETRKAALLDALDAEGGEVWEDGMQSSAQYQAFLEREAEKYSADAKQAAEDEEQAHVDNSVTVAEREDQKLEFKQHKEGIFALAVRDDLVVSGDGSNQTLLWNQATGEVVLRMPTDAHTDSVVCAGFSYNGKLAATGGMDGVVNVYKLSKLDRGVFCKIEGPDEELTFLKWHPTSNYLAVASTDSNIWVFDGKTGDVTRVIAGHSSAVTVGEWSVDGKELFCGDAEGNLMLWNVKDGKARVTKKGGSTKFHEAAVTSLAVHPAGNMVLTASIDGSVVLTSTKAGNTVCYKQDHKNGVETVGFCLAPQHTNLFSSADLDGKLYIYDIKADCALRSEYTLPDGVTQMKWHPTKPLLYTACLDRIIRCFDGRSGDLVACWGGHLDTVMCMEIGETSMLTAGDDSQALRFDLDGGFREGEVYGDPLFLANKQAAEAERQRLLEQGGGIDDLPASQFNPKEKHVFVKI